MTEMDFLVQPIDFLAVYLVVYLAEGFPISLRDSTCDGGVTISFLCDCAID